MSNGRLVLVVGPSGVGKDSIINAAKTALGGQADIIFPRRIITRPSDPDSEDHDTLDEATFARLSGQGAFFLHWPAHGLHYALPGAVAENLADGATVIANVSRSVVTEAQAKHPDTLVICITASPAVLEQRLLSRGREDLETVRRRLARSAELPSGVATVTIVNDGSLEAAVEQFLSALAAPGRR